MANLEVSIAGVKFRNPLILASATPGWDGERLSQAWKGGAGAVVPKTLGPSATWAKHPRCGRMKLVKNGKKNIGMINIELYTTMGLEEWLERELVLATENDAVVIASIVAQPDPNDTAEVAKKVAATGKVVMFEINVSCPMPFGTDKVGFQMGNDPEMCRRQVEAVKAAVDLPVGIKLTPTSHNMVPMALAAEEAGADTLTIANSVRSFAGVDIKTGLPRLAAYGGYSGPAIRPITMRHVSEVARAVKIPIQAVGGVTSWEDVIEYIMLGASAVQICTSIMWQGYGQFQKILDGLGQYMEDEGLDSLEKIRGKALPHIKTIEALAQNPPLFATLDPESCSNLTKGGCELCGNVCFYGAIKFDPNMSLIRENCDGCGLCIEICPKGALTLTTL
ncbi:tRNA-dihydrouridine synthase [Desulfobacula sp.]|uniref:tRNA-dihydrouridine synthase n=1 Tax=Desulfobacula sp. TaxID=2593537 RepID=UPI00260C1B6B|nr:tRNA-dihydrouridine synthase [Desulfobacula sp.]